MSDPIPQSAVDRARLSDGERRVVLVTGAGKGLGAAFAMELARRGARVVVNNRLAPGRPDEAEAIACAIRAAGGEAVAERSDVTDPDAAEAMVTQALTAFGRLDAVIANAGAAGDVVVAPGLSLAAFSDLFAVNVLANVALAQAALPHLIGSGAGRLVFVTSAAGLYGVKGRAPYAASKGALNALALTLAAETRRHGVCVNLLAPYAATRMTADAVTDEALGERLSPAHVAPVAAWLTSPACARTGEIWLTGAGLLRRVRIGEGTGARVSLGADTAAVEALAAGLDAEARAIPLHVYPHAEAAFAEFLKTARVEGAA